MFSKTTLTIDSVAYNSLFEKYRDAKSNEERNKVKTNINLHFSNSNDVIGKLDAKYKEYLEAKTSFNQAFELLQQKDDKVLKARCYALLAKVHLKLNQFEVANGFAKKNLALTKELKKSPVEEYIIFLGDPHIGATMFLKNGFERMLDWTNGKVSMKNHFFDSNNEKKEIDI